MSAKSIRSSIAERMQFPITCERLAKEVGQPLLLVQKEVRGMCRLKLARSAGSITEDGETRLRFQREER